MAASPRAAPILPRRRVSTMSDLADLFHYWSNDLQQGPTGDLAPAYRADRTSQCIIRRLMTNPGGGDYPWEPDYGAGLPAKIGDALDIPYLTALIIGQIALEASVARDPAPQVLVTQIVGGAAIQVIYYDQSGQGVPLSFNLFAAAQPAPAPVPILESVTPPSARQLHRPCRRPGGEYPGARHLPLPQSRGSDPMKISRRAGALAAGALALVSTVAFATQPIPYQDASGVLHNLAAETYGSDIMFDELARSIRTGRRSRPQTRCRSRSWGELARRHRWPRRPLAAPQSGLPIAVPATRSSRIRRSPPRARQAPFTGSPSSIRTPLRPMSRSSTRRRARQRSEPLPRKCSSLGPRLAAPGKRNSLTFGAAFSTGITVAATSPQRPAASAPSTGLQAQFYFQ